MARKIILNLAMSLDGFIADQAGGYDWIKGDGNKSLNTPNTYDYNQFLEDVDLVVMGKRCYDQSMHLEYPHKAVWIVTHEALENHENLHFVGEDFCQHLQNEKEKEGKSIYLFGGGVVIDAVLKAGLIDEYWIGIIPVILGSGRPLFHPANPTIELELLELIADEGIVVMKYKPK